MYIFIFRSMECMVDGNGVGTDIVDTIWNIT